MPIVLSGVKVESPGFLAAKQTWISKRGNTRNKGLPMRLLCLGLSRTGTVSLRVALHRLGYRPYHGYSMIENPPDSELWHEALQAKFCGVETQWTREGFNQVLSDADAVLDVPANLFVEELLAAYPGAKVVLTTRDADQWYRSWLRTIAPPGGRPLLDQIYGWLLLKLDPAAGRYVPVMEEGVQYQWGDAFTREDDGVRAKTIFRDHASYVTGLRPDCLVFDVKEGWEPLCAFLGHEIPRDDDGEVVPFPHLNDAQQWNDIFMPLMRATVVRKISRMLLVILIVVIPVAAAIIVGGRISRQREG